VKSGYVPTTALINGDGELLMAPLIGAYGLKYGDMLDELLNE
jgi:hypothetical protein